MSTQPKEQEQGQAIRSIESMLAEILIMKKLGWKFGFFSGGFNQYKTEQFEKILKYITTVYGDKIWVNIGPLTKEQVNTYKPYIQGVAGSIETVNKELHKFICPSKPMEPYLKMFEHALDIGLKTSMTFINGLGEKKEDFELLKNMIEKYKISKIYFYALNPQKGTIYENQQSPSKEQQAWWIAKTRINFPKIDIECGVWLDKVDRIAYLLKAGANSFSKFPATKKFNSPEAHEMEKQTELAKRKFLSTMTKMPDINWEEEIQKLDIPEEIKQKMLPKLKQYLQKMS
jgi:biotin synthase-like enzyme